MRLRWSVGTGASDFNNISIYSNAKEYGVCKKRDVSSFIRFGTDMRKSEQSMLVSIDR